MRAIRKIAAGRHGALGRRMAAAAVVAALALLAAACTGSPHPTQVSPAANASATATPKPSPAGPRLTIEERNEREPHRLREREPRGS